MKAKRQRVGATERQGYGKVHGTVGFRTKRKCPYAKKPADDSGWPAVNKVGRTVPFATTFILLLLPSGFHLTMRGKINYY